MVKTGHTPGNPPFGRLIPPGGWETPPPCGRDGASGCALRPVGAPEAREVGADLRAPSQAQLPQDAADVALDGRRAEDERGGDLGVGPALRDQRQDPPLLPR